MIEGKLHHYIGPLDAPSSGERSFAQLYVHDPAATADQVVNMRFARMHLEKTCSKNEQERCKRLLRQLTDELTRCNKYVRDIKTAGELFTELAASEEMAVGTLIINAEKAPDNVDKRTYHHNNQRRTFNEVTVLTTEIAAERDIIIRFRNDHVSRISEQHRAYDALHFVLLMPCGDDGWRLYMPRKPKPVRERTTTAAPCTGIGGAAVQGFFGAVANDANASDDEDDGEDVQDGDNGATASAGRGGRGSKIPPREFYAHRLQVRVLHRASNGIETRDDSLFRGGRLFQEYCCTALYKTESNRLLYQKMNQKKLRSDTYQSVRNAVAEADATGVQPQVGKRIILASSFTGGPRDQQQRFQDAIAVVRKYGAPSFFVTMTCNPKWPEILDAIERNQSASDRPDIVARVFRLKLERLLHELLKDGIFGKVVAHLFVIEFQKRGLPHAHILLILKGQIFTDDMDEYVAAELPPEPARDDFSSDAEHNKARERYAELRDAICRHMTHGPCGCDDPKAPCMVDGKCKKCFPKKFLPATRKPDDAIYPEYRRRRPDAYPGARVVYNGRTIDNSWIVPFSPYLLLKYDCHINVETCVSMKGIKYLYKYCFKGPDRVMAAVAPEKSLDEIELYQDFRSIGASEGCWRTFDFPMYGRNPAVERLPCHLENEQACTYPASPCPSMCTHAGSSFERTWEGPLVGYLGGGGYGCSPPSPTRTNSTHAPKPHAPHPKPHAPRPRPTRSRGGKIAPMYGHNPADEPAMPSRK